MAYGARLESVLGASPRGFESPILRHRSGTVRFRIFYALFTPAFPSPGLLPRSPLTPGPPLTPSTHSPEPSLLPAHLVQAPALLPALLFLDDATPHQACRHLSRTLYIITTCYLQSRAKQCGLPTSSRLTFLER